MRSLQRREKLLLAALGLALLLLAGDGLRRRWDPSVTVATEHYEIQSTAARDQTEDAGRVAEFVHGAYVRFMVDMGLKEIPHGKLQMRLYATRDEFRLVNKVTGWAEAFYREPVCHQYFDEDELNPYHWMVHEAAHQLNREAAGLSLPQWLNEGIADCFGTSRIEHDGLRFGEPDSNTYPVWWMHLIATSKDLETDKRNGSVIPLKAIVSGRGGPEIDRRVNLYYLHWWTLARHLLEANRAGFAALLKTDGDLAAFERHIGSVAEVEREWYASVLALKAEMERASTPPVRLEPRSGSKDR